MCLEFAVNPCSPYTLAMNTNKLVPKPSALTNELITAVSQCIENGLTAQQTIDALSIGRTSFYRYLSQGELDESENRQSIQRDLWNAVKGARARTIEKLLTGISTIGFEQQQWAALAWTLERVYGYRRDSDMNVTVNQGYELPTIVANASLDELNNMLLALNDGNEEIDPPGFNKS